MLGQKPSLNKLKKMEILSSIAGMKLDHDGMKLEINYKKMRNSTNEIK